MQKREIFIRPTEENDRANIATELPVCLCVWGFFSFFFFFFSFVGGVKHSTAHSRCTPCRVLWSNYCATVCVMFLVPLPPLCRHLVVPLTATETDPVLILYKELKCPSSRISHHLKWLYLVTSRCWVSVCCNSIQAPENATQSYHFGC